MNTKLVILSIITIVVIGGVWWWYAGQSDNADKVDTAEQQAADTSTPASTPTPESSSSASDVQGEMVAAKNAVILTDDGFEPANIVVPAGGEVHFINQSSADMWIASDPHPDHTDLSGFDQGQVGDEYTFVFEQPGAYTYHNEENESQTGLVLVEE